MQSLPGVRVHESCWPEAEARDLADCFRQRRIQHKFHYQSYKQARLWLALHEAYAPVRRDPLCQELYDRALAECAEDWLHDSAHVIALGCGGGQKEVGLLRYLAARDLRLKFTPQDTSLPLVLTTWNRARVCDLMPPDAAFGSDALLCDLAAVPDPGALLAVMAAETAPRLVTFFGMAPNFEPSQVWPQLKSWVGSEGRLLLSANLAPGSDYEAGVEHVRPMYDNASTNAWLMQFLHDLGLEPDDGTIQWSIEPCPLEPNLLRIAADYHPAALTSIEVERESARFQPGQPWRLFYSYRHTPDLLSALLQRHGLRPTQSWIDPSGEEGVFLCELA